MVKKLTPPKGSMNRPSHLPDDPSAWPVAEIARYQPGELIEVDPRDSRLYLVNEGLVSRELVVISTNGVRTISHATLEKGCYFNPRGLAGVVAQRATANIQFRAVTPTKIIKVKAEVFVGKPDEALQALISFVRATARIELVSDTLLAGLYAEQQTREAPSSTASPPAGTTAYCQPGRAIDVEALGLKLTELETANAVLGRDLKQARNELHEARTNIAKLEAEAREKKPAKPLSERFPTASRLLIDEERQALAAATKDFRRRSVKLQQAIRELRQANPAMVIPDKIARLLRGEELPPNPVDVELDKVLEAFVVPETPPPPSSQGQVCPPVEPPDSTDAAPSSEDRHTIPFELPADAPPTPLPPIPRPSAVPKDLRSNQAAPVRTGAGARSHPAAPTSLGSYSVIRSDPPRSDGQPPDALPDFSAGDSDLQELLEEIRQNPFTTRGKPSEPRANFPLEAPTKRSREYEALPAARPPMETISFEDRFPWSGDEKKDGQKPPSPPPSPRRK